MVATLDRQCEDAVGAGRGLVHGCGTHLPDEVTGHEQVDRLLFGVARVDGKVLQVQVTVLVLKERNLVPLVE